MITAALALASIFGISSHLANRYKVSGYITPIITACSIGLIMYVADMMRGAYAAAYCILFFGIYCIFKRFRDKTPNGIISEPTPFIILAVLVSAGLANIYNQFSYWDEFSHWGLAAKFLAENRALITNNQYLYFRDYPPGLQYIGYYFTSIGGYDEGGIIFASAAIALLSFLPTFSSGKKNLNAPHIFFFSLYLALVMTMGQGLDSALADQQMSAIAMSLVLILWTLRDSDHLWLAAAPVGAFLALTKQPGYYIYALIVGSFSLANFRTIFLGSRRTKIAFITSIAFVTLIWASWKAFVLYKKISPSVASANPIRLLKSGIECCDQQYQYSIINNFVEKLLSTELIAIYFLVFTALLITAISKSNKYKKNSIAFAITMLAGFSAYLIQLLLHYMFAFGHTEGLALASFDRFMMPFVFIFFGFFVLSANNHAQDIFESGTSTKRTSAILALSLLITATIAHKFSNTGIPKLIQRPAISEKLNEIKKFTYKNSSVLIVWENDGINNSNGLEYWVARQELAPRRVLESCYSFSPNKTVQRDGDCIWESDTFLLNALSYNYIVFLNGLDEFIKKYPSIKIQNKNAKYFTVNRSNYSGNPSTVLDTVIIEGVEK